MADQERRCAGPFSQSMHDTHVAPWTECGNLPGGPLTGLAALGREEAEEESEKLLRIHAINENCGG